MGVGVFAWRTANALERPAYTVLQKLGSGVELRRYEPYVIDERCGSKSDCRNLLCLPRDHDNAGY